MKIYLAHQISGLSGQEVLDYYDQVTGILRPHYQILSPMIGKRYLQYVDKCVPSGYVNTLTNDHSIFQRDTFMVSQADIVFCDFTGANLASIGCCMELAIASFLNKHTVVVMDKNNIHNHAFINEASDVIFENFDDAIDYLLEFAGEVG